jgi:general L-amino acid transport system substrate-binding protein
LPVLSAFPHNSKALIEELIKLIYFVKYMHNKFKLLQKSSSAMLAVLLLISIASCGGQESEPKTETTKGSTDTATSKDATQTSRLDKVIKRGRLICGVSGKLPGFSFVNEKGEYLGMDVDLCRAVAAALFDDPNKVEYRNLSAAQRFTALQTGEIDLLARNTTWTIERDIILGMEFTPTTFYDTQGIMVATDSGAKKLEQLQGKTICVKSGTTSEQNLADQMSQRKIKYTSVVIGDDDALYNAYVQGRCEAITADRTQLVGRRATLPDPEQHTILDTLMSKEPLGPLVVDGDAAWFDAVKWITYAMIQGEEFGINSKNFDTFVNSANPDIKRFLGTEATFGETIGLPNDFAARVIKHVGNYGEVYDRNIGKPFGLERGLNNLWTEGGLLYSPPFR